MPHFLHQVSYTSESWRALIAQPQDRLAAVRAPIEKLGGKLVEGWLSFGDYDVVAVTEMPDNISAAAIAIAFAAGSGLQERTHDPIAFPSGRAGGNEESGRIRLSSHHRRDPCRLGNQLSDERGLDSLAALVETNCRRLGPRG